MAGIWPLAPLGVGDLETLRERLGDYMVKAVREAKLRTTWTDPDPEYEAALRADIEALLATRSLAPIPRRSRALRPAHRNRRAVERDLAAPCSIWRHRACPTCTRATSFGTSRWWIRTTGARWTSIFGERCWRKWSAAPRRPRAGRGTSAIWSRARRTAGSSCTSSAPRSPLASGARRSSARGDYVPLEASGPAARHVVAFGRGQGSERLIAVAPRLLAARTLEGGSPTDPGLWAGTDLPIPDGLARHAGPAP